MLWFETARRPGSCGWSGQMNTPKSPIFTTENLFWAAIPMPSAPGLTFKLVADILTPTLCHEMAESFTDRNGNGWVAPNGCEIGDVCENESADRLGHWRIERYWSDADLVCFPVVHGMPYSTFLLQTGTPIGAADGAANFGWAVADFNGDGMADLFGIKATSTGTKTLEIHVLDSASSYQKFLLQTGTKVTQGDVSNFHFLVAPLNRGGIADVFALRTQAVPSGKLQVRVLDDLDDFQSFALQAGTPIDATDAAVNFSWAAADFDRDGVSDLYGIKTGNTGTGTVEVHVLGGIGAPRVPTRRVFPVGDPIGYATDVPRMVYRGVDNHIYELAIYPSTGSWGLFDM